MVPSSPRPDQPLGSRLQQDLKNDLIAGLLVVIPLATLEALAELRPLLERAGCAVAVAQFQAWRGAPLAGGTRLAPLNPVLVLKGRLPAAAD